MWKLTEQKERELYLAIAGVMKVGTCMMRRCALSACLCGLTFPLMSFVL